MLFRCTTSWVKVLCWLRVWFVTAAFSQFPVVRFLLRISGQRTKTKEGRRKKESPPKKTTIFWVYDHDICEVGYRQGDLM
uniref:Putative secreted protein n=1 Tax=Ixodes scapularis TaxID=6945 RepID=A0A4D5RVY8_IXOSC